jgi:hypothetical protein
MNITCLKIEKALWYFDFSEIFTEADVEGR